jgi:redox-sensitive bicupin YhaK (pirin superfamily)
MPGRENAETDRVNRRDFLRLGGVLAGAAALRPMGIHPLPAWARALEETMSIRPIKRVSQSQPVIEGAGVHLRRAFGFQAKNDFDPFLLLDDFRSDNPRDYLAGFPWHPHRGIETITYVLAGQVNHQDSLGNRGALGTGDVQWMTAGGGILHQEMPAGDAAGRWMASPRSQATSTSGFRPANARSFR